MTDPGRRVPLPLLSKSLFRLGSECPTKVFYRLEKYPGAVEKDAYAEFLAEGGFLFEALVRALFPRGRELAPREGESPAEATRRELAGGDVDLFEAEFEAEGMRCRADIVSRRGNRLRLIEVKAASYDSREDGPSPFRGRRGGIDAGWRPYLEDLAFQTMVVRASLGTGIAVCPELALVDKAGRASREHFESIELRPESEARFGIPRARFHGDVEALGKDGLVGFLDASGEVEELIPEIRPLAEMLARDVLVVRTRPTPSIGRHCRDCEYRGRDADASRGFLECWGKLGPAKVHFLDLYGLHLLDGRDGSGIRQLLRREIRELVDIPDDLVAGRTKSAERQRIQIECTRSGREWIDPDLRGILAAVPRPLHFVDFETSRVAVPYHAGMRPYEQIAFQFSCHTLRDGEVGLGHRDWINLEHRYPNVEFAEALREAIGEDGSMLVWSDHERTALREIRSQLVETGGGDSSLAAWLGRLVGDEELDEPGRLVDLHDLCREHYLHPRMRGRTSIKAVLPAIWESNAAIRAHPWFAEYVREEGGRLLSPYDALEGSAGIPAVRDGTAAMRTYQEMLYGRRKGDVAYRELCGTLLRQYCRLDTAAMVIVWMHWNGIAAAEGPSARGANGPRK